VRCAELPECARHLEAIKQRVYRVWRPTRPLPRRGAVRIRFRLDPSGQLRCAELLETTAEATRGLGTSCLAAFGAVELPPLPDMTPSLAGIDLEAIFRYERAY